MEDSYEKFAEQYDRFEGAFDQHNPAEMDFFSKLFSQYGVQKVLDCACGTGHHLHMCSQLGVSVTGSDLSQAMLNQAHKNLASVGLTIPLHQMDYRSLPDLFGMDFDAVLCLRSSILHMPNDQEALKAFSSMYGVLKEGGILVLTQGTTDRQWTEKPRFLVAVNDPDFTRLFVIDYEGKGARYNILDIHHKCKNAQTDDQGSNEPVLETFSVEYPRIMLKDEQQNLLKHAGFSQVYAYGSYWFSPYDKETSQRLILVAVK